MSNFIFVLDTNRKLLNPCRPITARKLLLAGKVRLFRRYPLTIILNKEVTEKPKPIQVKIDPGSKTTGIALVQGEKAIFGAELGRLAVRSTGSFNISTVNGLVQGISHKYCQPIHKKDGYSYAA
jgi:hypothetical protein